ncbi:MAG: MFS transporter [Proteobacteria bacterium]|nr:MFS transporter [Pseudomonadota bacterium]
MKNQRRPAFFYGWIIIAIGFVTLGVSFGVWYSFSVFILAIVKEFGWSRAAVSSIFSTFILSQAVAGMVAGYLQDRFGPRIVIPIGTVLLSISLVLTSRSNSLWGFQIAYGLMAGASVSLLGFASHSAFIPKWFERKRGLALGIAMSGIGFGMLFLVPLVEYFISAYGWRNAYLFLAAMVLFLIGPMNMVFARRSPAAINQHPDGDRPGTRHRESLPKRVMKVIDHEWAGREWTLGQAAVTKRFWLLALSFFTISFAFQGVLLHAVSAMVDAGMASDMAAYYFGIAGITGSVGKILFGYLSDLSGRERIKSLADMIAFLGIVSLMAISLVKGPMPFLFAVFFGLGYGAAAPLIPAVTADIFMGKRFGFIFAMIGIGGGLGGAVGSYVCGLLRDSTGSYTASLVACCVSLGVSSVLVWFSAPRKVRQMVAAELLKN